jgi:hypothetical protein
MISHGRERLWVMIAALIFALASARPYAGGWNDGSRLATVEALVDHGTFAIDDSIFVRVPPQNPPYPPDRLDLIATGTLDKLCINGRFYSDKGPVPALVLAGCYALMRALTGLTAAQSPSLFCYLMNFLGGGVPLVVAGVVLFTVCRRIVPSPRTAWWITGSLVFTTVAAAYARHHNGHILMLSVAVAVIGSMHTILTCPANLSADSPPRPTARSWVFLGVFTGFGYTVDLAVGPAMVLAVTLWVGWQSRRFRSVRPLVYFGLGALPWGIMHHALVWQLAGMIAPPATRPEYLDWAGSPFSPGNMTGLWHERGILRALLYAAELVLGLRGFLWYNLPILPALLGIRMTWRRFPEMRSLLATQCAWVVLAGFAYGLTSNNYSGQCLSIRWFVPMLAPAYLVLIFVLRTDTGRLAEIRLLSVFSFVLAAAGWWCGPWERLPLTLFWIVVPLATVTWLIWRTREASGCPRPSIWGRHLQFFRSPTNNKLS